LNPLEASRKGLEPWRVSNPNFKAWLILAKPDGALEILFDQLFKLFFILHFEQLASLLRPITS
jgi:hypothetical protein